MKSTVKTDSKKRIVLPGANAGDVYDICEETAGTYRLVKMVVPENKHSLSEADIRKAMNNSPLESALGWEELKQVTREE